MVHPGGAQPSGTPQGPPPATPPQGAPYGPPHGYAAPRPPQQPAGYPQGGFPPPQGPQGPGAQAPGFGYGGGYGQQPARKKRPVALLVALAVVLLLIIGVGGTLAAIHPWSKDKKSGTDATTKSKLVTGDLDGDGLGDVQVVLNDDYNSYRQLTGTSDGKQFTIKSLTVNDPGQATPVYMDFNNDGKPDPVTYAYSVDDQDISFQSSSPGLQLTSSIPMRFHTLETDGQPDVGVQSGDFNGDGNADLLIYGQDGRQIDVYTMLGKGDGAFGQPKKWLTIPNALIASAHLTVGDFDGDGKSDLWGVFPTQPLTSKDYKEAEYFGNWGTSLFKSTGSGFPAQHVIPLEGYDFDVSNVLSGDVTGTGRDSLVTLSPDSLGGGMKVVAYNLSTGSPVAEPGMTLDETALGNRDDVHAVLSDVDGDGKADIVYLARNFGQTRFFGFRVIKSTGKRFEKSTAWGDVPPCKTDFCELGQME